MDVCGPALVVRLADFVADYEGDDANGDEEWLSDGYAACSQSPEKSASSADV
jgi:hypothetical protein